MHGINTNFTWLKFIWHLFLSVSWTISNHWFSPPPNSRQTITRINTMRPRQNGRHFADDIFKCIFMNENVWISIETSLKFVRKCSINNITALVLVMAWRRPGDKPLSGPMMVRLPTHICVTRPQWVNENPVHRRICMYMSLGANKLTGYTILHHSKCNDQQHQC